MRRSALLAGMAAATTARARAAPLPGVRIAVLGDSLALATGASQPDGGFIFPAYRAVLARRPGSLIDSLAIGGSTVADVERVQVDRLGGERYDIVIVCVGGNDVVHGTTAATFAATYRSVLARIAKRAPGARIVCCGVPDVSISPIFAQERDVVRELAQHDDRSVRAAAATAGAAFVDLFSVTHGRTDAARFLGRDRFHPSDSGYALLNAKFQPVLDAAVAAVARSA